MCEVSRYCEYLLVIYASINEAVRSKKEIDIQFYDLAKCFDAMCAEETMNNLYDAGEQDENFAMIGLMNRKYQVKVKTRWAEQSHTRDFL